MVTSVIARCIIVTIGTLYPAYRSYKSLINSDLREVVNCLRYWIVFAIFIAAETITDVLLSWFPFYYWIKIGVVLWLISPAGSTYIYKRFIQPLLKEREREIDQFLEQTKAKSYSTLIDLGHKGIRYASSLFLNGAVLGQQYLGEHLKRSFSASDIVASQFLPAAAAAYVNKHPTLAEEEVSNEDDIDGENDAELNVRLREDRKYLKTQTTTTTNRRPTSQYQASPSGGDNEMMSDENLNEMEMENVIRRAKQRVAAANNSKSAYSSNQSAHIGTISKGHGQMLKQAAAAAQAATSPSPSTRSQMTTRKQTAASATLVRKNNNTTKLPPPPSPELTDDEHPESGNEEDEEEVNAVTTSIGKTTRT